MIVCPVCSTLPALPHPHPDPVLADDRFCECGRLSATEDEAAFITEAGSVYRGQGPGSRYIVPTEDRVRDLAGTVLSKEVLGS